VVRCSGGAWRFLLLRAYRNWDFPKGLVERDEEPLDAARREVAEETLITDLDFAWGTDFHETGPYARNKVARYYLARTDTEAVSLPVRPELGRAEHNEARWFDLPGALAVASPRLVPVIEWAAMRIGVPGAREPVLSPPPVLR
jgi:8-oxo-dGTP pyrophosphatase MutT (NUDIX family)